MNNEWWNTNKQYSFLLNFKIFISIIKLNQLKY